MLDQLIDGFEKDAFCDFLRSKFPSFSESRRTLKVGQAFLSAQGDAKQGGADIPVCHSSLPIEAQTEMSAPPCRMPDAPLAISQRRLPHWQVDGAIYWVTFRLADSIPQETLRAWRAERDTWMKQHPEVWTDSVWAEYDERFTQRMEQWLDAGTGSRALACPAVRDAVKACLLKFDGQRLRVHAAVIMPTHVHCVIEPLTKGDADIPVCAVAERQTEMSATLSRALSKLLQGIKGASARAANQILGTSGMFWMDESYDHIVRNARQYRHFIQYIAENPARSSSANGDANGL
jgi:putative transposase